MRLKVEVIRYIGGTAVKIYVSFQIAIDVSERSASQP
jgi:hypothetical protein